MENTKGYQVNEDVHQAEEYGKYMERIGWRTVQITNEIQIFVRKVWPGAIAKIQRVGLPIPWEEVHEVLRKNKVFMCKLEPLNYGLQIHGFRQDSWPLLGTKTLRIDLRSSEEHIFNSFKKDARYCLRKLPITNYQFKINEFDRFYEIWRVAAKRKNLWIPKKNDYLSLVECFGKKVFCVIVNDMAGCLVLTHKGTAFYYFSGALSGGKELELPYAVVWEAMKEARKRGCRIWDFEGIYDSRWPNKGWLGFSHFKKSFGGQEVEFLGSFSRWSLRDLIG